MSNTTTQQASTILATYSAELTATVQAVEAVCLQDGREIVSSWYRKGYRYRVVLAGGLHSRFYVNLHDAHEYAKYLATGNVPFGRL
jgi:hypothetical protein